MIPQGYKKINIGLIPEEWEVEKLEKVIEFRNGFAHEKIITDDGKCYLALKFQDSSILVLQKKRGTKKEY